MLAVSMATGGLKIIPLLVRVAQVGGALLVAAIIITAIVFGVRYLILGSRRPSSQSAQLSRQFPHPAA